MIDKQILNMVWKQFNERRLRSTLTTIGIAVGIAALISLVLLSGALKSAVTGQLDAFGSDIILIAPKAALGGGGPPTGTGIFTSDDVAVVENIPQIIRVTPFVATSRIVQVGRERFVFTIRGVGFSQTNEFADFINLDIESGRYLQPNDINQINVGNRFAKEAFSKELFVGNTVLINDRRFTIAGIFEEQGDQGTDFAVFMTIAAARNMIGDSRAVTGMSAQIAPGADIDLLSERIENRLKRTRGRDDFAITTPAQIQESIGSFLAVVDLVVLSIALVSLFVASLGIMNSLYTSVLQRTKEIGTLKAVGARNSQILTLFLTESALLGAIGGLIGIIAGVGMAFAFIFGINSFGFVKLEYSLNYILIIGSLLFSIGLAMFAGLLPAYRASRLKPIDALRHE